MEFIREILTNEIMGSPIMEYDMIDVAWVLIYHHNLMVSVALSHGVNWRHFSPFGLIVAQALNISWPNEWLHKVAMCHASSSTRI